MLRAFIAEMGSNLGSNEGSPMSPERSHAYRRVMKTLSDLGPSKLQADEQDRIREAADTLVFSADLDRDPAAGAALEDVEELLNALIKCGRWQRATAEQLADDLYACGPTHALELTAA
jgi:hypothetical protein